MSCFFYILFFFRLSLFLFFFFFFFFNDPATTEIYTLPLHDALPIYRSLYCRPRRNHNPSCRVLHVLTHGRRECITSLRLPGGDRVARGERHPGSGGSRQRRRRRRFGSRGLGRRLGRLFLGRGLGGLGRGRGHVFHRGRRLGRGERQVARGGVGRLVRLVALDAPGQSHGGQQRDEERRVLLKRDHYSLSRGFAGP